MRVRWTPASAADLQQISDYLASHHPEYRQSTMRTLYNAIKFPEENAESGAAWA